METRKCIIIREKEMFPEPNYAKWWGIMDVLRAGQGREIVSDNKDLSALVYLDDAFYKALESFEAKFGKMLFKKINA